MRHLTLCFALFTFGVLFLLACPPGPVTPPPDADASAMTDATTMSDATSPAPDPFGFYDCTSWCKRASVLNCLAAQPTEHGASCLEVCTNTLSGPAPWNLQCRTLASSCAAADNCEANMGVGPRRSIADAGADATAFLDAGDAGDSSTEGVVPATCAGWCAHASTLKCLAAKPTPKGASCVEVCNNVQSGPSKWNLKCRVSAKTCAAADACK